LPFLHNNKDRQKLSFYAGGTLIQVSINMKYNPEERNICIDITLNTTIAKDKVCSMENAKNQIPLRAYS
jgi:hypothetical protein